MAKAKKFTVEVVGLGDRLDALPNGEGDTIRRRVRAKLDHEITAHERTLAELRKAKALTQVQIGAALGVTQAQVSRIEHQTDLYLSTLQSYLEAMGGRLEVVGVFDDEEEVRVPLAIGELDEKIGA